MRGRAESLPFLSTCCSEGTLRMRLAAPRGMGWLMTGGAAKVGTLLDRRSVRRLLCLLAVEIVLRRRESESVGEAVPD